MHLFLQNNSQRLSSCIKRGEVKRQWFVYSQDFDEDKTRLYKIDFIDKISSIIMQFYVLSAVIFQNVW